MPRPIITIGILCLCLNGCGSTNPHSTQDASAPIGRAGSANTQNPALNLKPLIDPEATIAFINGRNVTWNDMIVSIGEAAGGRILAEVALEQLIDTKLAEQGRNVTDAQVKQEEKALLRSLHRDPGIAVQILNKLRRERGLGRYRYDGYLRRNAGLRVLVQDAVQVTDQAVADEYELRHGPRYEARLIVVDRLEVAKNLVARVQNGESFVNLAIANSLDASKAQGGLLPLISAADPSYPASIRAAVTAMQPGQVSEPVMLENGFAILRLERKIDQDPPPIDQVRDTLAQSVRERITQNLMKQLARSLLAEADIVVLDPAIKKGWDQQRQSVFE